MADSTPDEAAARLRKDADEFESVSRGAAVPTSFAAAFWTRYDAVLTERDGLRTELLTTQQILAHAERQRDEAEARLAAQQPVIDAARYLERTDPWSWDRGNAGRMVADAVKKLPEDGAASGSVEAADDDLPACPECGHESDHSGGECMWYSDELVNGESVQRTCRCSGPVEADTPAEPDWERRQRGVRTALFGTDEEVQAALAERRAAAEPDDECPACAAANRPRPMRDLAAVLRVDAALPDTINARDAFAHCAYTQARDALRTAIGIVAQLASPLDAREVAGTPAAESAEVQRDRLRSFADWLIRMDDPDDPDGLDERRHVTLTRIIERAREARRDHT